MSQGRHFDPLAPAVRGGLLLAFTAGLAVSITLAQTALAVLALWLLAARRHRAVPPLRWPLAAPLVAFAGWTLVAALLSARPLESLVAAKSLLTLATLWIVLHALPDAGAARRFATAVFAAVAAVAALSIVQVALCPEGIFGLWQPATSLSGPFFRKCSRARGFYSIYMTLAGVLTLVLVGTLPRLPGLGRRAWWTIPAWLAGTTALALTFVRGAWVGFALGAVGAALGVRRRLAALVVVAGLGAVAVLPGVLPRLRTIGDAQDSTTRERILMLQTGLRLAREHPVAGVGPGQLRHLYPAYAAPGALRRSTSHLHNTPLQILVERGVPGLIAWLAIFGTFFARAAGILRRLPAGAGAGGDADRALVLGAMAAIAAFLVAGLFEYNFGDTEVLLVAMTLMALPFVIARDRAGAPGRVAAA